MIMRIPGDIQSNKKSRIGKNDSDSDKDNDININFNNVIDDKQLNHK